MSSLLLPLPSGIDFEQSKAARRHAARPQWLQRPVFVDAEAHAAEALTDNVTLDAAVSSAQLVENIKEQLGVSRLFAIQRAVVPALCRASNDSDILVSAPTGSGKTLAYAAPIVDKLLQVHKDFSPRCLRALIVLPTRELVRQVADVFRALTRNTKLVVAQAAGGGTSTSEGKSKSSMPPCLSFAAEQRLLCGRPIATVSSAVFENAVAAAIEADLSSHYESSNEDYDAVCGKVIRHGVKCWPFEEQKRGSSNVDILVATPGRLLEHLNESAPDFTLQHLEFLVLDEADKILSPPFSDAVRQIQDALRVSQQAGAEHGVLSNPPSFFFARGYTPHKPVKILVSATITRNPEKIGSVGLVNPILFATSDTHTQAEKEEVEEEEKEEAPSGLAINETQNVQQDLAPWKKYVFPQALRETLITMYRGDDKPKVFAELVGLTPMASLLYRVSQRTGFSLSAETTRVLVFTGTAERAQKLVDQIQREYVPEKDRDHVKIDFLSRNLPQHKRTEILDSFRNEAASAKLRLRVLVASDVAERGLDILNIDMVVNYDHPSTLAQYVHRVGRTARAGAVGHAFTLLARNEASYFFHQVMAKRGSDWKQKVVEVRYKPKPNKGS